MAELDVLIVTAVAEEYAAVLAVGGGEAAWVERDGLRVRDFEGQGGLLTIAVTQAHRMGAPGAVEAAGALRDPGVRCLAMCGVCAGKRNDVELGDVIIADRVFQYDTGKKKAEGIALDLETFQVLPPAWTIAAGQFQPDPAAPWLALRPRSYEVQGNWVLERLLHGVDPMGDAQRDALCADWKAVLARLRKAGLMEKGSRALTPEGRAHIDQVLEDGCGQLPALKPLKVHVGPIGSGSMVVADGEIFAQLCQVERKVLGVEMEAAAIGMVAWAKQVELSIVAKAVMDHGDADKNDNFKAFAARASAEVLIAFLRKHLAPRGGGGGGGGGDEVLVDGTSPLPGLAGPAALLNARHEVVPFQGRVEELAALRAWCEGGAGAKVRLLHAAGGMGKTRLGIELCRLVREDRRWRAGFLREGAGIAGIAEVIEGQQAALVVIDYAESRVGLEEMLAKVAVARGRKKALRVLLLARNAGAWWADVMRADGVVGDLLREEEASELVEVTPDRTTVFHAAVAAFAEAQGKQAPKVEAPSFEDKRYERALYVHAAALAAVEGREVKIDALMEDTLDHEERFWRQALSDRGQRVQRAAVHKMRLAVAALTLKGGAESEAEARGAVDDEEMMMLLRDLYPGRAQRYVGGLEPDLLGEAMVRRALSGEGVGAEAYLRRVFEGVGAEAIRTGFTVLGRLSEDHKEAEAWIAQVLARDVAGRAMEAFAATKIVGERTAHAALGMVLAKALEREGTVELAERMEGELPHPEQTVSLREVGRWVLATTLAHLPEGMEEERAQLSSNLSVWQSALGQREAALASTQEAVDIRRKLARARPEAFLPSLAQSLNNLGAMQSALGQREAALASTREAVDIRRKLARARPEAFLPDLAMSLHNLGLMQSALGQREAALASSQEAADTYRKLARARPEAFLPYLAMSLNNLGNFQSALGQREAALASTQEAADTHRKLARARPEAFLPSLAQSLNNLGAMQSALGQREAALASSQEAVDTYRKLARARPEAFLPDLAGSLNNLGNIQSDLGQREAALASSQEAADTYRKLARARPEAFLPYLAMSLNNLGLIQSALGQREAALASTQEAIDTCRKLARARPEAFLRDLAASLNNLGNIQSDLGQREAALASSQEAVDTYRKLARARPEAFLPDLAMSLNNLGNRQSDLGQRDAALASSQEAIDTYRKLARARPEAFLPDLAQSLHNLGLLLRDLGHPETALACAQEALDSLWPLYFRLPAAFAIDTGDYLGALRERLAALDLPPTPDLLAREAHFRATTPGLLPDDEPSPKK